MKVRRGIKITIVISLLFISVFFPVRGYALNSAREITYKNVNTVLTKEDIDLKGGSYVFSGLTDTLPYTVTEDDLGTNDLTIYDGQEKRTVKIVVTETSREVDRDGWTVIEASDDTRIVYVSSSEGDDVRGVPQRAKDIGVEQMEDVPDGKYLKRLTPIMEDYESTEGSVRASSENSHRCDPYAWKAFNRQIGSRNDAWISRRNSNDEWLQFRFENPVVVGSYAISLINNTLWPNSPRAAPKDWTIKGSHDGSNWTVLDKVTEETDWNAGERRTYTLDNNNRYSYYRIHVINNNGGSTISIAEFDLMGKSKELIPVSSWGLARDMLRNQHPDWVLFKRGDIWEGNTSWNKSGRSLVESLVIGSYGEASERPFFDGRISIRNRNVIVSGIRASSISTST